MFINRIIFSDIFGQQESTEPEHYLKDIPSCFLRIFAFNLSKSKERWENAIETLRLWFSQKNTIQFNALSVQLSENSAIRNKLSDLRFLEYFMANQNSLPMPEEKDYEKMELAVFKAYLCFNEQQDRDDEKLLESINKSKNPIIPKAAGLVFAHSFPTYHLQNYDYNAVLYAQLVKLRELLEFLSTDPRVLPYLKQFLALSKSDTLKDYAVKMLALIKCDDPDDPKLISVDPNDKNSVDFLNYLTIDGNDTSDIDFSILRAKPLLYDPDNHKYYVVFSLFLLERLYSAVYFQLSDMHKKLLEQDQVGKDFKGFYGLEFTERWLLYKIFEKAFDAAFTHKKGQCITAQNKKGQLDGPDYYLREDNKAIYLFECKDMLANANNKHSFDYDKIEHEFKEKFYFKLGVKKSEPKAVRQLLENAKRLLEGNEMFGFDKNEHSKNIPIYLIIVVDSQSLNTLGVNQLIQAWFKEELEQQKKNNPALNWKRVRPAVLIDLDTFIFYGAKFRSRNLVLSELIDDYRERTDIDQLIKKAKQEGWTFKKAKESYLECLAPFSFYMRLNPKCENFGCWKAVIEDYKSLLDSDTPTP